MTNNRFRSTRDNEMQSLPGHPPGARLHRPRPDGAGCGRVRAGQWTGTTIVGGKMYATSSCVSPGDAQAMNGDAKAVKVYIETIIPPEVCKITDLKAEGEKVTQNNSVLRQRTREDGHDLLSRRPFRGHGQHRREDRSQARRRLQMTIVDRP